MSTIRTCNNLCPCCQQVFANNDKLRTYKMLPSVFSCFRVNFDCSVIIMHLITKGTFPVQKLLYHKFIAYQYL